MPLPVLVLIVAGLVARIWVLLGPLGAMDSEEAWVGLMARHILQGEIPVFFWGQAYGGTSEPLLVAAVFALIGSSAFALKLTSILVTIAAALLVWRAGLRLVTPRAAALGAALLWAWPSYYVVHSTRPYGFYSTGLLACAAILLIVARLDDRTTRQDLVVLGVVTGLGWWTTFQIAPLAIPALGWLAWRKRAEWRLVLLPTIGFALGAAPWIVYNLAHSWDSFETPTVLVENNTYFAHIIGYFHQALPTVVGLRLPGPQTWVIGLIPSLVIYVGLIVAFLWATRKGTAGTSLLGTIFLAFPFVLALSPWAWFTGSWNYRYLYFLGPAITLLGGWLLVRFNREMLGITFALLTTVAGLAVMERVVTAPERTDSLPPLSLGTLVQDLQDRGIETAFANYWTAVRITFESDEKIVAAAIFRQRYEPHDRKVRKSTHPAYVLVEGSKTDRGFRAELTSRGLDFTRFETSGFAVYALQVAVLPEEFPGLFPPDPNDRIYRRGGAPLSEAESV